MHFILILFLINVVNGGLRWKYLTIQELEKKEVDQGDEEEEEEEEGGKKKEEGEVEEEEDEIYDEEDIEEVSLYVDKKIIHRELIA